MLIVLAPVLTISITIVGVVPTLAAIPTAAVVVAIPLSMLLRMLLVFLLLVPLLLLGMLFLALPLAVSREAPLAIPPASFCRPHICALLACHVHARTGASGNTRICARR